MSEQNPTTALSAAAPAALSIFDPAQLDFFQRLGNTFVNNDFVPAQYQYKPQPIPAGASEANAAIITQQNEQSYKKAMSNCIVAINMAKRMNADPLMVMNNLDVIHGRPSFRATFLIATVNACGRFKPLKFKFASLGQIDNGMGQRIDNLSCYAYTTEKDSGEELKGATITVAMAVQQGWYNRTGSKWPSMPEQMLQYRAAAFWQRIYAPEISMGMMTTDEAYDADAKPQVVDVPSAEIETIE